MSAFARGMQLGQQAWTSAEEARIRNEELGLRKAKDARDAELHGMTMDEKRRAVARENELAGIRTEMADFTGGINRPATNAALDADFEQAYQATAQGLAMPKMAAPSNAANEAALTVRAPVDTTSPQFQQGLAALRSRYALASGDMKDFDAVTAAERARITAQQDSDFALQVVKDPTGEAARGARSFVNSNSRRLSSKVDPKTGMTTFALVNGDGYDEIKVPPADLGKIAVGYRRLQRGDIGGLDVIAAVNKDLAAVVREELKLDMEIGKANNDANYKSGSLANDAARTSAIASNARSTSQNVREFVDAKGNTVLLDIAALPKNRDGSLAVPAGLRPKTARAEVTTANVIDYAKSLVENNTPDPDAPNKPLTLDKAMVIAREQLGGNGYKTAADRLVEAYLANRGNAPAPQPAAPAQGVKVPPRQITTIVPPRSAADLAPRQPATEEEIIKMLAR